MNMLWMRCREAEYSAANAGMEQSMPAFAASMRKSLHGSIQNDVYSTKKIAFFIFIHIISIETI